MERRVRWAAAVGFGVTIAWDILIFVFFTLRGPGVAIFSALLHITCPPSLLQDGILGHLWTAPFLNAAFYAAVAFVILGSWRLIRMVGARAARWLGAVR
jgi:hypothetical protein